MAPAVVPALRAYGGHGPLVALVPSLGRSAADFDDLGRRLAAAGFRAIAIEPIGIGQPPETSPPATLHDYAASVAAALAFAGASSAHLVGHAFGNRVVRMLATGRPEMARSVSLIACGGQVPPDSEASEALQRCFMLDLPPEEHLAAVQTAFFAPGNDPSVWRGGWYPEVARMQQAANRATSAIQFRHAGGAAPMLIIQGLQDRIAPPANGHVLKQELGDRVRLVDLDGAGHALLPEQPGAIAEHLLAFLSSLER